MVKTVTKSLFLCLLATFAFTGCAQDGAKTGAAADPVVDAKAPVVEAKKAENVYQGKVVGKSEKAKTISIAVGPEGKAETFMVKFNDKTKGLQFANKDEASIITYEVVGEDKIAIDIKQKLAKLPAGVTVIKTEELKGLIDKRVYMVLADARPESRYNQAHLPGAVSITVEKLKEQEANILPPDKNALIIYYCGGLTCGLSTSNAELTKKLGYTNVKVYLEGEPAWGKAGYKLYASNDYITTGNIVLIDLRSSSKAIQGRIPRSVSVPYEKLAGRVNDIPRNAPVVLYSDKEEEAVNALKDLKEDGFKFVSLVQGNYQSWVAGGRAVEKGSISSNEITWVRKIGKGEITVDEFKKATEGKVPNVIIVDARTKEEVAELGTFKNTIHIPLDELSSRIGELPKDKKIYIHCSTGARADLAYQELMKRGYDAKFLLLNIDDAACDCVIIRP